MDRRKELAEQYKTRKIIGGVYRIVNTRNGRFFLQSAEDMQAARNRFRMSVSFGGCALPPIQADWNEYGGDAFVFEELELLEKGEAQTPEEYKLDIQALHAMWSEQLPGDNRY